MGGILFLSFTLTSNSLSLCYISVYFSIRNIWWFYACMRAVQLTLSCRMPLQSILPMPFCLWSQLMEKQPPTTPPPHASISALGVWNGVGRAAEADRNQAATHLWAIMPLIAFVRASGAILCKSIAHLLRRTLSRYWWASFCLRFCLYYLANWLMTAAWWETSKEL